MIDPVEARMSDNGQELFRRLAQQVNGFPPELGASAAINILVKIIRQFEPTEARAQARLDFLVAQAKDVLTAHYRVAPLAIRSGPEGQHYQIVQTGFDQ